MAPRVRPIEEFVREMGHPKYAELDSGTPPTIQPGSISVSGDLSAVGTVSAGTGLVTDGGITAASFVSISGMLRLVRRNMVLVNGDNHNISLGGTLRKSLNLLIGPTAPFSVTGFAANSDGASDLIFVFNSVAFQMTIRNENAGSDAANRITTLTGADVVLRAGTSFATFLYDSNSARWILVASN